MKKFIFFIITFLFWSYSPVLGSEYLYDNFTSKDMDKWDFYTNGGTIEIVDNNLYLSSNGLRFPYLINKNDNLFTNGENQTLNIKFKYNHNGSMGNGISIGFTGSNGSFFEQFQIWRDSTHGSFLAYHDLNTKDYSLCSDIGSTNISTGIIYTPLNLNDEWHILKIKKIVNKYEVYIDPDINNQPVFVTDDNQCEPKKILLGNIYTGGGSDWNNLFIDSINVGVTVASAPKTKIIIIPGLGASWNTDAIVYNKSVGADKWKMTPFVKNYDGLINALKKNGLEENVDFYIWNYDWRRPVSEIVTNLDNFINKKVENDEKVILIGHSLGGLVSRIWAEDNNDDSRLEKVINLGSPNLGSIDGYEVWNGGQISDLSKVSSIAYKILLKIQGLTTKTDMEAVRKYLPVIKDLLPTFNYVNKNGKVLNNDKLETNNTFLKNKNTDGINSKINLKLFTGNGFKTINSIELKNNSVFDNVLGIWPDGRINKFVYSTSGDGTVLIRSANYGKSDAIEINSKHGEIIDKTINQVMIEVGLSQVDMVGEFQDLSNNLVVFVGSPVDYSVKCDSESPVNDNDGFVVIKNKNYKSCNINLVGNGDGLIHVVAGNTNDTNWSYWEKNITNGEINNIKINPINGQIVNNKDNISFLKTIIKADINSLLVLNKNNKELKEALKSLDKNQPKILIRNIFNFRMGKSEMVISEKIIDNTTSWLSLTNNCSKNEASKGFKVVDGYQDLIDNLIKLNKNKRGFKVNENAAISYQKMNEILELNQNELKQKNYTDVCANNFTALNYGTEVLIKAYNKDYFKKWLLQDSNL
ncbi:MAG: hypothetical protein PHS06_03830 [Candidatus Shapirobacteria bacterium]|nr:hypothetical protein [Candidatus Shapirobacteria bacterium]